MRTIFVAALLATSTACAVIPDTPRANGDAAAQGTAVAIGEPVWAGDTILTPISVTQDSRCPMNARCVWAGKLTVSTRIAAAHWTQTAPLTLGEPYEILGRNYTLVSATPEQMTDREIPVSEYRFVFERR